MRDGGELVHLRDMEDAGYTYRVANKVRMPINVVNTHRCCLPSTPWGGGSVASVVFVVVVVSVDANATLSFTPI